MNLRIFVVAALAALVAAGCTVEDGKMQPSPALEKIMPDPQVQTQRQAFDINNADNRREGILRLSKHPSGLQGKYLDGYTMLAKDEDPSVRSAAIVALGRAHDPAYLPTIVEALGDTNDFVRIDAADVLNEMTGEQAVEPLCLHAARDPKMDVRTRCLKALSNYKQPRVYRALLVATDDPEFAIRLSAGDSLTAMTGQHFGQSVAKWREYLSDKGLLAAPDSQPAPQAQEGK